MIVQQVQILDCGHLFTRASFNSRHQSKFSILCCEQQGEDRDCLIYAIAQYNFLLHIYNLPFE